ncbi:MAG TPA: hypothetical protein PLF22_01940 [Pseudomonadales bacterium]|nr:hypothetical protein [Pseudomonadales bacterium]
MAATKNILLNGGLLLVSVCLSLLLLEQGFRIRLFGWQAFDVAALRNNVPVNNAGIMRQSAYDDIYWELLPNLDTTFKMAHLHTNSYGLADQEYPLAKPHNTYRIAVLGDSYSMASGVDTDKSYHALLEDWMNRQDEAHPDDHSRVHYEFINFAVGGFGLERYNATLAHKVAAWQPDAILLGYCGFNDHMALPPATGKVPPFNPPRADGFWMSYVLAYINMKKDDMKKNDMKNSEIKKSDTKKTGGKMTAGTQKNIIPFALNQSHFEFIERELGKTRALADSIGPGMPIVLAYLDNRPHAANDLQTIAAIAKKSGMAFVDTSEQFADKDLDDYSIQLLDSHPNDKAQQLFAETLFASIKSGHWFGFQPAGVP